MLNLIRAEWFKIIKNRPIAFFIIGSMPVLTIVFLNLLVILNIVGLSLNSITQINWQEQVILTLLFANQFLAQMLFIILASVSFGSEFSWQTWKNILPRTGRYRLVISKFIVISSAILIAIQAMVIMTIVGSWEVALISDVPFVAETWDNSGLSFGQQYFWLNFCLFCNFILAAIYASIIAIQTKSTSASIVLAAIIAFTDTISQPMFNLVSAVLRVDFIAKIPSLLPNYHIQNILSWVTTGNTVHEQTVGISSSILILWIFLGIGLASILFQRRDID